MGSRIYVSTRVGPFRVGTSLGGGSSRPRAPLPPRERRANRNMLLTLLVCLCFGWIQPFVMIFVSLIAMGIACHISWKRWDAREAAAKEAAATVHDAQQYLTEADRAWFRENTPEV